MKRSHGSLLARSIAGVVACVALAPSSWCSTWIVDCFNGPGAHFTDIPPAIAAAAPGDVIVVRQGGFYSSFTLNRGLTIVGQGNVEVGAFGPGIPTISAVPAAEIAAVSNIRMGVVVDACAGTVLLQVRGGSIRVQACVDVRIRDAANSDALHVVDSRVQIAESSFFGADGWDASCFPPTPAGSGQDAFECTGASRVHLALSTFHGGSGGWDAFDIACWVPGGPGGNGIDSAGPAGGMLELLLFGSQVNCGPGGGSPPSGPWGKSLVVGPNVTAWTAQTSYSPFQPTLAGGTLITQPAVEPTLELIGTPAPGATITLRLRAQPGTAARLNAGTLPIVQPTANVLVERLLVTRHSFDLGLVPASGILDTPWQYRQGTPKGQLVLFQASLVQPANNQVARSNSVEAIVP